MRLPRCATAGHGARRGVSSPRRSVSACRCTKTNASPQRCESLREHPDKPHALDQVARKANLSPSRFLHLFKAATGVPFRRYRMWVRMGAAVRSMTAGRSLTEAALAAGFASSSHFSTAFREMFGLSPSQLTAARLTIQDGKT